MYNKMNQLHTHTHTHTHTLFRFFPHICHYSGSEGCSVVSDSFQPHGLYSPWNSPGQNTGVGSLSLLQGIFPTQGSNPSLSHCRQILYQLSHKGSPRILKWVAYPFSRGPSQPRNPTRVSCIAGGFFINWIFREALCHYRVTRKRMKPEYSPTPHSEQTQNGRKTQV